jgi:hypothetical protein
MNKIENEARKTYYKEWRAKNKDKVRQHNQNFWKKRAEALKQPVEEKETSNNENATTNN